MLEDLRYCRGLVADVRLHPQTMIINPPNPGLIDEDLPQSKSLRSDGNKSPEPVTAEEIADLAAPVPRAPPSFASLLAGTELADLTVTRPAVNNTTSNESGPHDQRIEP